MDELADVLAKRLAEFVLCILLLLSESRDGLLRDRRARDSPPPRGVLGSGSGTSRLSCGLGVVGLDRDDDIVIRFHFSGTSKGMMAVVVE